MKNTVKNLLTFDNAKTIKGEKYNYKTAILYLSPYKANDKGKNLCPFASKSCVQACLNTAGMGIFSNVQQARRNKTNYFLNDRINFFNQLNKEILKFSRKFENFVIRLNGTSDIPFENLKPFDGKNIFEINPKIQFYDYTKDPRRMLNNKIKNYHLTFSLSEEDTNRKTANWIYNNSLGNVAIVLHSVLFDDLFKDDLKSVTYDYKGTILRLFNGDLTDLRFQDPKNSLICLKAKGKAKKDISGFVLKDIEDIYNIFK